MRHLKYFSLFESKTHSLTLPKTQNELDKLKELPGFKRLEKIKGYRRTGCDLFLMRNGGVEIISPVNYNFKVSPTGNFYYGGLQVGPKYDTNLDTWDKLFDYVYLYFLGTGLRVAQSDALENFVFHGVITTTMYSKIKNSDMYSDILELSRKYVGKAADEAIDKIAGEASSYINDPSKVLETPSYKFFDRIFGFTPDLSGNHTIKIVKSYSTPFGLFDSLVLPRFGGYSSGTIIMNFIGSGAGSTSETRVKTMNGLNKAFLKNIMDEYDSQTSSIRYYEGRNRKDINIFKLSMSRIVLSKIKGYIDDYVEGREIIEPGKESIENLIREGFYTWTLSNDNYIECLIGLVSGGSFDSLAAEIASSAKTKEILNSMKDENIMKYSKTLEELESFPVIKNAIKDITSRDADIIKGGSTLRSFGFDDED
jgi:hypothetical protein